MLSTTVNRIPKGKLAFAQLNNALEYSVNNGATWNEIITNDFAKPEKLLVRIKEIAGTQDNNSKPVGFIACSEPSDVPIADANIGTLVVVTDAEICVTTPENGTLSFGNTVTAIPVYSENAHVYNSVSDGELSYKWFYELDAEADEWQQIAGANSASYIIEETASIAKKLKVEITQSHPNGFTYTGDGTSVGNVVKGSLSAEFTTLNYTDAVVVVGGTLSAEKISSTIYTNQAGTQVTPVLEFTNSVVPEGACSVNAKANLAGYNDLPLTVVLASVKAPAPTSSCFESFLSGEISFIPKNYIRFTQEAVSNHLLYSTDGINFTAVQANQEIQITNSLYLKTGAYTGAAGPVSTSDVSENLFSSLSDYLGLCLIKAGGPNLITFESEKITLTYLNNVITATVPSGITITKWEIAGESLSDFATVSADKTTLTFASNAVEGTYNVTIWAFRNGNIISTTCIVTLEDSGN
ncbi:MAG: hypothetical protein K6A43_12275 [Treponema sp.]|nr:hypothetical protein [Treponema sp.]